MAPVEIDDRHRAYRIDAGIQRAHRRRQRRRHHQAGDAGRQVLGDEPGHDRFGPGLAGEHRRGGGVRVVLEEHPQGGAQQHIERPHRQRGEQVHPQAPARLFHGARGAVALHGVLVAGVFRQPVGQADQQHHGDGLLTQRRLPAHRPRRAVVELRERELARRRGFPEHLTQAAGQRFHHHPDAQQPADHQHHGLQHVGPDHRVDAADNGVQADEQAGADDRRGRRHVHQLLDQQRQQPQDHRQAHQLGDDERQGAVHPHAGAEALFQKLVGAGHVAAPEKRQEHIGGHEQRHRQRQVGQIAQPAGLERVRRVGQEGDRADRGAHQGEADHPSPEAPPADEILLGAGIAAGEVKPDQQHHRQVGQQHPPVEQRQGHC